MSELLRFLKDMRDNGYGLAEIAAQLGTSAIAEPVAGYAAMYDPARGADAIREGMTYQPRSQAAAEYQGSLNNALQTAVKPVIPIIDAWKRGVDIAGSYNPYAGAVLKTVPAAIGVALGAKPALQQGRAIQERLIANANAPRTLNAGYMGQRGAVHNLYHGTSGYHQSLSDDYSGSVSSGDGRGHWFSKDKNYAWEYAENAAAKRGGEPRVARAIVEYNNPLEAKFDDNGVLHVNGMPTAFKNNSEVIDYALENNHDAIDWVNGSFTDEPSVTTFKSSQSKLLIHPDDIDDVVSKFTPSKSGKLTKDMYDVGFKNPVVTKTSDGFYTENGDYIHESIDDAIMEDIEKQAKQIKDLLTSGQ